MTCLLYCIFEHTSTQWGRGLSGVAHRPVEIMGEKDLRAAVTYHDTAIPATDIDEILRYTRVIDSLHQDRTVIPMRFGSMLDTRRRVCANLSENHDSYIKLLHKLHGKTEIGIRVLFNGKKGHAGVPMEPPPSFSGSPQRNTPGKAYLLARKSHYTSADRLTGFQQELIQDVIAPFQGLYSEFKSETQKSETGMISLYFLVPGDLAATFGKRFRAADFSPSIKVMLSGTWPPYNFVCRANGNGLHADPWNTFNKTME